MRRNLPLISLWCGRDVYRRWGFRAVLIVAPFPPEEQIYGELCAALIHAELCVGVSWLGRPVFYVDCYCADRWKHCQRAAIARATGEQP